MRDDNPSHVNYGGDIMGMKADVTFRCGHVQQRVAKGPKGYADYAGWANRKRLMATSLCPDCVRGSEAGDTPCRRCHSSDTMSSKSGKRRWCRNCEAFYKP